MRWLRTCRDRLRVLLGTDVAAEIDEEIRFHLDQRIIELERQGLSPAEARRAALQRFGSPLLTRDRGYDVKAGTMETIRQDVSYALRMLRKQPAFTLTVVVTLGLGIGASTSLFCVIDAAVLRPLPYSDPERLVTVHVRLGRGAAEEPTPVSPSLDDGRLWREHSRTLRAVGSMRQMVPVVVDAGGGPERVQMGHLDDATLRMFGVVPVVGRDFGAADVRLGTGMVVLLGYGYWQSRFG